MRTFRLNGGSPLFNIGSYGRAGPGNRLSLTQIEQIRRAVTRTPEVMVKVTSGKGSSTSRGVNAHFDYISRAGELEIETDDGDRLLGEDAGQQLINDWDLDLEEDRKRHELFAINRRQPPKLVHKIIFSMPAGTPPEKVRGAIRDFAREEFGRNHRYAMVLRTDEQRHRGDSEGSRGNQAGCGRWHARLSLQGEPSASLSSSLVSVGHATRSLQDQSGRRGEAGQGAQASRHASAVVLRHHSEVR